MIVKNTIIKSKILCKRFEIKKEKHKINRTILQKIEA